ncbi:MAG: HDIG domain-containing protein [Muribaculaceae bacterium]|nr:HDIG domain-containing protein [Muribaculaceae bacterium]
MTELKNTPTRIRIVRLLMLIGAAVIALLVVPRNDHQSYSYELNQPWRYQLLTAEFDMPIMRDSASQRSMRDSIEANFSPFVIRNTDIPAANIQRLRTALSTESSERTIEVLTGLLGQAYQKGIVAPELYKAIQNGNNRKVRHYNGDEDASDRSVTIIDGSGYMHPRMVYNFIDSAYSVANGTQRNTLPANIAKALTISIVPDIVLDTVIDAKFRNQEYLNVTGALGVIKKGQRIVDRGEIVTPQIYTNLNTYQEMLVNYQNDEGKERVWFMVGQFLYILICFTVLYLFLYIYRSDFFASLRNMAFLMTLITLFIVVAALVVEFVGQGLYLIPFSILPVIILVFFDSRTAIISLITTIMLCALLATFPFQFIFLELLTGLLCTFSIHHLSRRSQLLRTAVISLVSYIAGYIALCLLLEGALDNLTLRMLLFFFLNSVILSFAYVLILIIEKVFGFTSMVTLVELSDINNPLLRRLAEEAPGTFQHSMQVSTLAAEAARAIGANTQLVRTGALYHDIGKMESPIFFTENQHGVNPHAGLDPETSADKIIRHVTDGLALANKSKLPSVIRDFISEHHGRGVTKYFYNTAINESNGRPVDRNKFMYPGPNPRSRETAILMMADCVEAASRSLQDFSPAAIDALVDKIIDGQVNDGMFRESPLSFRDVDEIKRTFKKRLATIYHSRVAYPELKNTEEAPDHHDA